MRNALTMAAALAIFVVSACGSSTEATSNSPAAGSPSASASPSPTGSLDPCQLVTASEASALAGVTYSAGKPTAVSASSSMCVYSSQTSVVQVLVAQAADAATAQAQWTQEQANAEARFKQGVPAGVNVTLNTTNVSVGGADKAAIASGSATIEGQLVGITAIYLLKGAVFLTFSDLVLGHAPPGAGAMQAQASTSVARLP